MPLTADVVHSLRRQLLCYMNQSEHGGLHSSWLICFAFSFIFLLAPMPHETCMTQRNQRLEDVRLPCSGPLHPNNYVNLETNF